MKKRNLLNNVRIVFLFLIGVALITSCTKEGPIGLTGAAGTNGTNGINGKDANSSCLKCHNQVNQDAKMAEYHLSKHFTGTSSSRNTKYCSRCHTNEGFQEITGKPWALGAWVATTNDLPNATRISCATCHTHAAFDFAGDTVSQILRTTTPVSLAYKNYTVATDYGKINNLCVTCHQIRGATSSIYTSDATVVPNITKTFVQLAFFPLDNTKEATTVKYQVGQSFSVHDGNQSNLFKGENGYEYANKTYTKTWKHSAMNCTDCHMNTYNATTKLGGHTLMVNLTAANCVVCHTGTTALATMIAATQTSVKAKLTELGELLSTRKVFKKTVNATTGAVSYSAMQTHDFLGTLFPATTAVTTTLYATALAGANTVSPTTGLVVYGNTITMAVDANFAYRIGREWKYGELGAAYNYVYVNSELSFGIHNPGYAIELLQKSIDWLVANP